MKRIIYLHIDREQKVHRQVCFSCAVRIRTNIYTEIEDECEPLVYFCESCGAKLTK